MDASTMLSLSDRFFPLEDRTLQPDTPYDKLDRETNEIRLVQIVPGHPDESVSCLLVTFALNQAPGYIALSYAWGRPGSGYRIRANDRFVEVTANVSRFLHEVRRQPFYAAQYLWIDALSINQADHDERTHQVNMMSRIYRGAKSVVAWLGPAYGDSDHAIHVLNKRMTYPVISRLWRTPKTSSAIFQICDRKYWSRLWVVQELVLARNITLFCGRLQVPWVKFQHFLERSKALSAVHLGDSHVLYDSTMAGRAAKMIEQIYTTDGASSLYEQILQSEALQCADKRDKVYAVLGIVKRGHESIFPDYLTPLPDLLNHVLRNEFRLNEPRYVLEIDEKCVSLAKAVGVETNVIFTPEPENWAPPSHGQRSLVTFHNTRQGIGLRWAISFHQDVALQFWLKVRGYQTFGEAMQSAAAFDDTATCDVLLRSGLVNVNFTNAEGQTALWVAAQNDSISVMRRLLEEADVATNHKDIHGETPLARAVHMRHGAIAVLLREAGSSER